VGKTLIEKILARHAGREVSPGDIVDVRIDTRVARDFGGPNVVKNLRDRALGIDDPSRTFFTFDCNPTGSDQKYAANQHLCRTFARQWGLKVFDIDAGIGTHLAIDNGLVGPGSTFVSTDSHANILGAIGAFGQGMGDVDIAQAFANGSVWFRVPPSVRVVFKGTPSASASAKDLVLAALRGLKAGGLLGYAAEMTGPPVDSLSLPGRITISSMATEMGAIIALFAPTDEIIDYSRSAGANFEPVFPDPDASYGKTIEIDVDALEPLAARPGHPDDVVPVSELSGTPIDSAFIGSCTNGRFEDLAEAAHILKNRKVAPGVVLKIVPATDAIWRRCLNEGLFETLKAAGALISNPGCAGCAAGQVGQNGPGEVTVSTGNRNFAGKQGAGEVYLVSPATAAASALAGTITTSDAIPEIPLDRRAGRRPAAAPAAGPPRGRGRSEKPQQIKGRIWAIDRDNIDTDMIYHNRYLTITDVEKMGQYTFDNLTGWEDFSAKARPGDIVVTGENFGCGSSRQQAVDCFKSLGVQMIVAKSFGAIYERNAINNALPVIKADLISRGLSDGDVIEVDLSSGRIRLPDGSSVTGQGFSEVQMDIYRRGGLLEPSE